MTAAPSPEELLSRIEAVLALRPDAGDVSAREHAARRWTVLMDVADRVASEPGWAEPIDQVATALRLLDDLVTDA